LGRGRSRDRRARGPDYRISRVGQARLDAPIGARRLIRWLRPASNLFSRRIQSPFADGSLHTLPVAPVSRRKHFDPASLRGARHFLFSVSHGPHPGWRILADSRRFRATPDDLADVLSVSLGGRLGQNVTAEKFRSSLGQPSSPQASVYLLS